MEWYHVLFQRNDPDLSEKVKKLQAHHQISTCLKKKEIPVCRFSFTRLVNNRTVCLESDEAQQNEERCCNLRSMANEMKYDNK